MVVGVQLMLLYLFWVQATDCKCLSARFDARDEDFKEVFGTEVDLSAVRRN